MSSNLCTKDNMLPCNFPLFKITQSHDNISLLIHKLEFVVSVYSFIVL